MAEHGHRFIGISVSVHKGQKQLVSVLEFEDGMKLYLRLSGVEGAALKALDVQRN